MPVIEKSEELDTEEVLTHIDILTWDEIPEGHIPFLYAYDASRSAKRYEKTYPEKFLKRRDGWAEKKFNEITGNQ